MPLLDLLLGRKLANREAGDTKIGTIAGIPAMGLDGLGSSAYGPEAALTILIPLGAGGLGYVGGITAAVLVLLGMLFLSYWQTIKAYPSNGGSYVVARENLGENAGLLAATALMIDYVLNVAVGISAGVAALTSAVPSLHPYTLPLCLAVLAAITLINLRGTEEAGLAFSVPTYLFVASFALILGLGIAKAVATGGHPQPVEAVPALPEATGAVGIWILLRAFASGCTAMTGVESVSNGVNAFREPTVKYAHRTLTGIVLILGALLAAIAYLVHAYGIGAMDQTKPDYQSVLSQLAGAVTGRGTLYFVAIGSLLAVLCLSANTSYVGFPRVCHLVARDGFLPKAFAIPGRRLVYSVGVLFLTAASGGLLVAFGGITDRLIPLFAVGAFMSFTLSQAGMALHWHREAGSAESGKGQHRLRLWINAAGAVATGVALAIIIVAKFAEGAWITMAVVPCVLLLLRAIHRYYQRIEKALEHAAPSSLDHLPEPPVVLVPIEDWNALVDRALCWALTLSPDVVALHLTALEGPDDKDNDGALRRKWRAEVEEPLRRAGRPVPRLVQMQSQYRSLLAPLLKLVLETAKREPGRNVAIVLPELVEPHWWAYPLHVHRAAHLRARLLRDAGEHVAVLSVPWHLTPSHPARVVAEEEPKGARPTGHGLRAQEANG